MQKSHIITPALGPGTSVCRMLLSALACETRARKTGGAAAAPSMSFKILKHFCFEARNPCATAGCGDTEPGGEWMAVCKADCLSNYTLEISVRCTVRLKIVGLAGCDQSQPVLQPTSTLIRILVMAILTLMIMIAVLCTISTPPRSAPSTTHRTTRCIPQYLQLQPQQECDTTMLYNKVAHLFKFMLACTTVTNKCHRYLRLWVKLLCPQANG